MIYVVAQREVALPLRRGAAARVGAYVGAVVTAEAVAAFAGATAGAAAAAIVLLALLGHYVASTSPDTRVLAALALVPLAQLTSLALATGDALASLALAGAPVLVAVVLALRALELPGALAPGEIRLRSQWQPALAVAALALLAAPLVHGEAVTRHASIGAVLLAAPIVFVFAGVVEELVFRGAVQGMLEPLLGGWSVPVADLVFGAAYLGSRSPTYAVFMTAFGLACGWWVRRTRSLAGVAVAHGGLAVVLLVLSTS